jgi:signal transduction histidine kinase
VVSVLEPGLSPSSFEIGIAHGMGKPVVLLVPEGPEQLHISGDDEAMPELDAATSLLYGPDDPAALAGELEGLFREFLASPEDFLPHFPRGPLPPVDFDRLEAPDFENLCFELLTQLGFRRVDWGHLSQIDLVASLPRTDPDNFRYEELWLCSLGFRAPLEEQVEMAARDPHLFLERAFEGQDRATWSDAPVTFLGVAHPYAPIDRILEAARGAHKRFAQAGQLRVRIWDQQTLRGLVNQHPQLVVKYFSDYDRSSSGHRKSVGQLYEENVELAERLQAIVVALEEERDRRLRAERDAIWKDVAFTAAHKLGNPIFALETDLLNLDRELAQVPESEGSQGLVGEMADTLEKAKRLITQFKSLTKVREIKPRITDVVSLLRQAARVADARGVEVDFPPSDPMTVYADPERLGECFDEVITNSLRWIGPEEGNISIRVEEPDPLALPEGLLSERTYAQVTIADNGPGIPEEHRDRIFVPFFTTDLEEGTGMGLPIVQRTLEEHGGLIEERDGETRGAEFVFYIPRPNGLAARNGV